MELVDCHTHTRFSDGTSSVAQNVARAAELGISTLCCTDHLTLPSEIDPACEVSVREADLADYARAIEDARAAFPQVEVVFGFEADFYSGCEANVARWTQGATFVLGSVHMLDGRWIDDLGDLSYWDENGTESVWRRYFEVWAQACASPCRFDSMAHPDLVSLLGRFPSQSLMDQLYDSAAAAAAACGARIELNTAGCVKPVGRPYPDPALLERFCKAGVPLTVGSDAHSASRVGDGIEMAYAMAWQAGYRRVEVPTAQGDWRALSLEAIR